MVENGESSQRSVWRPGGGIGAFMFRLLRGAPFVTGNRAICALFRRSAPFGGQSHKAPHVPADRTGPPLRECAVPPVAGGERCAPSFRGSWGLAVRTPPVHSHRTNHGEIREKIRAGDEVAERVFCERRRDLLGRVIEGGSDHLQFVNCGVGAPFSIVKSLKRLAIA